MTSTQLSNEKQAIRDVCSQLLSLEDRRTGISDQIRELKNAKIKGELGMKLADFNIAFRLYKLEHEDRDETLLTIRRMFNALDIGQQLDFMSAIDDGTTPESEEAADDFDDLGAASTEEPADKSDGSSVAVTADREEKSEHEHDDAGAELIADDDGLEQAGHAYNDGYEAGYSLLRLEDCPHDRRGNIGKQWAKGWRAGADKKTDELNKQAAELAAKEAAEKVVNFPSSEPKDVPDFPQAENR